VEFKGDMEEILNNVMCSSIEDEPRFSRIIKDWIKSKEVPAFEKFMKETKRSKETRKRKVNFICIKKLSIIHLLCDCLAEW
jgi:DnaJ family protein C protein 9